MLMNKLLLEPVNLCKKCRKLLKDLPCTHLRFLNVYKNYNFIYFSILFIILQIIYTIDELNIIKL